MDFANFTDSLNGSNEFFVFGSAPPKNGGSLTSNYTSSNGLNSTNFMTNGTEGESDFYYNLLGVKVLTNESRLIRVAISSDQLKSERCAFQLSWPTNETCEFRGFAVELTHTILSVLVPRATMRLVPSSQGYSFDLSKTNASELSPQERDTILGHVMDGTADVSAGDVTLTRERSAIFGQLSDIVSYQMAFILPEYPPVHPTLNFEHLFRIDMYILLAIFIAVCHCYKTIVSKFSHGKPAMEIWTRKMLVRQAVFLGIFLAVLFRMTSTKIVLLFNKPAYARHASTTAEILTEMEKGATNSAMYYHEILNPTKYVGVSDIFDRLLAVQRQNPAILNPNLTALVLKIQAGEPLAILTEELVADVMLSKFCGIRKVLDNKFAHKYYTMYYRRGTNPFEKQVDDASSIDQNAVFGTMTDDLQTIIRKTFLKTRHRLMKSRVCNKPTHQKGTKPWLESISQTEAKMAEYEAAAPSPLSYAQLKSFFQIFVGFNLASGCTVFLLELVVKYRFEPSCLPALRFSWFLSHL